MVYFKQENCKQSDSCPPQHWLSCHYLGCNGHTKPVTNEQCLVYYKTTFIYISYLKCTKEFTLVKQIINYIKTHIEIFIFFEIDV